VPPLCQGGRWAIRPSRQNSSDFLRSAPSLLSTPVDATNPTGQRSRPCRLPSRLRQIGNGKPPERRGGVPSPACYVPPNVVPSFRSNRTQMLDGQVKLFESPAHGLVLRTPAPAFDGPINRWCAALWHLPVKRPPNNYIQEVRIRWSFCTVECPRSLRNLPRQPPPAPRRRCSPIGQGEHGGVRPSTRRLSNRAKLRVSQIKQQRLLPADPSHTWRGGSASRRRKLRYLVATWHDGPASSRTAIVRRRLRGARVLTLCDRGSPNRSVATTDLRGGALCAGTSARTMVIQSVSRLKRQCQSPTSNAWNTAGCRLLAFAAADPGEGDGESKAA
jgi:hypothetical protein